jgi:hypothetical protein
MMVVNGNGPCSSYWLCFGVVVFGKAAGQGEERRALNRPFLRILSWIPTKDEV